MIGATRPRHHQAGMTLIEVMVVIFIIGLSAGVVVFTLPSSKSPVQRAAESFARTVQQAQDQAVISGLPLGLRFTETGYDIVHWRQEDWRLVGRPERLGNTLNISLRSEVLPVGGLGLAEARREDVPQDWPHIVFDPTGLNTALEFRITGRGERVDIRISETGVVGFE